MLFSEQVKTLRKILNLSQVELANQLDIAFSTINRIENNRFNPSYDFIIKFNNYCLENNVSFDYHNLLLINEETSVDFNYDISNIIEETKDISDKAINYLLIERNYLLGKRISEEIKENNESIGNIVMELSKQYGNSFNKTNLQSYIKFYQMFPNILHSNNLLSWSHYRILLQVEENDIRNWYEKKAYKETWSVKTLQRNISSQYYHRLLSSYNKDTVKNEMMVINQQNQIKLEYIKDPYVLEFLGINEDNTYLESDLEKAIINHLQKFLIELGKGYAFVGRQVRIHTEKQDYYIDLVFYNYLLKCFVLIDLKTEKISYQDVGQMDMYIKMYDEFKKSDNDNPTLGIILTSDTDEDIAKYSILNGNEQLFASKYKLYLPSEEVLKQEIENQKKNYLLKNNISN